MITGYVDVIHGDTARVVIGNDGVAVSVPVRSLPPGAREGTVLRVNLSIDHAATKAREAKKQQER